MKKNNKLTRKRAQRVAEHLDSHFVQQADGTEVLKSREARAKQRRWGFVADIEILVPETTNKDTGEVVPSQYLPKRTLKLEAISYCSASEVKADAIQHEGYLRATSKMFETSKIKVRAIPHETVSNETIRQITGYRDMALILDKALENAIYEASAVTQGKALGAQFLEHEAVLATDEGIPAIPARTIQHIKEQFYKDASEQLRPKVIEDDKILATTSSEASVGEDAQPAEPVGDESLIGSTDTDALSEACGVFSEV